MKPYLLALLDELRVHEEGKQFLVSEALHLLENGFIQVQPALKLLVYC